MALTLGTLAVSSPDFDDLGRIPDALTADGGNTVPRIRFSGVPHEAVELALICHDPDAPRPHGFTHWVVYGISPDTGELDAEAAGVRQVRNDAGEREWFGPQPPRGHGVHHYYFWVYALTRRVEGEPPREEFLDRYEDAVIEQARTVGTSSR